MTAAAGEGPRSFDRFMAWLSHYAPWFVVAAFTTNLISYFIDASVLVQLLYFIPLVLFFASLIGQNVHHHRIFGCAVCSKRFPWNGEALAERRRSQHAFRIVHRPFPALVVWLVLLFGPVALSLSGLISGTVSGVMSNCANLVWGFTVWAGMEHNRLIPWCPYCRRNGGGGAHEPSPDPDPVREKELT